jgi:hypothetical protein
MKLKDLIEALDQRYGNPYMAKEYALIQEAIKQLQQLDDIITMPVKRNNDGDTNENCTGK